MGVPCQLATRSENSAGPKGLGFGALFLGGLTETKNDPGQPETRAGGISDHKLRSPLEPVDRRFPSL